MNGISVHVFFSSCFLIFSIIFPSAGSPFRPSIQDSIDASKVKAHGPGLSKDGVRANVPAKFTVDATKAGKAPLDVTVIQEKGKILITNQLNLQNREECII